MIVDIGRECIGLPINLLVRLGKLHPSQKMDIYTIGNVARNGRGRMNPEEAQNAERNELLDQIFALEKRVKELENDLKLNASMLAKQCDAAREAEAKVKELENKFPCGHRKVDWDDSYGNCVACQLKEYADKYDDQQSFR